MPSLILPTKGWLRASPSIGNDPVWNGCQRMLESELEINGATNLQCSMIGADATASSWATRYPTTPVTFGLTGVGDAPTPGLSSPFYGALDVGVGTTSGGKQFEAPSASNFDFTTHDLLVEVVHMRYGAAAGYQGMIEKYAGSENSGYRMGCDNASGYFLGQIRYAGTSKTIAGPGIGARYQVVYDVMVMDRSGYGIGYSNGTAGSALDISAIASDSITSDGKLTVLVMDGFTPHNEAFYLLMIHAGIGWLDTHAQATVIAQRLALLHATRPAFSWGGTIAPSAIAGSASPAYITKEYSGVPVQTLLGAGTARTCRQTCGSRVFHGHSIETAGAQVCLQSNDLTTTWTTSNATATANTVTATSDGGYLVQAFGTITAVDRVLSALILRNGASDVDGEIQIVKTSTSAVIASQAFTATSTTQLVEVVGTCEVNDTEIRFVIDTSGESIYLMKPQFEAGDLGSSRVDTTTAAVTRAADTPIAYALANNIGTSQGAVLLAVGIPKAGTASVTRTLWSADDSSADNRVEISLVAGVPNLTVRKTAGTNGDCALTTSIFATAGVYLIFASWQTNNILLCCRAPDGSEEHDTDTSVTPPTAQDVIHYGGNNAGAQQPTRCLLGGWKGFMAPITFGEAVRSSGFSLS